MEKSKQTLELNAAELATEMQQLNSSRQEADRKKKLAEGTLQELTIKTAEQDRITSELNEKIIKLQASFFSPWLSVNLILHELHFALTRD